MIAKSLYCNKLNLAYRSRFELVLCPVHVEHGADLDEEPPPLPVADAHELADVLLDAAHGDVLGLK